MIRILNADCLDALPQLAAEGFRAHAVVTDPPAGISFMNSEWDGDKGGRDHWIAWMQEVATECLRVCKPGAHALVWALPRTSHWTATAWENAGWTVRDRVSHLFGTGFPKSHNLDGDWKGWGTALKPACEDWWLLRKPLSGTVAANTLRHGCGGLNIDACRVGTESTRRLWGSDRRDGNNNTYGNGLYGSCSVGLTTEGRWPANVCTDGSPEVEEAFAAFGERQAESQRSSSFRPDGAAKGLVDFKSGARATSPNDRGDGGSASRFFKSCPYEEHEWNAHASGAEGSTSLQSDHAVFALVHAVEASTPGWALSLPSYQGHNTSVTLSELRTVCAALTGLIQNIASASSLGLPPERHSLSFSHVRCAATPGPIGTMTITISRSTSSGFADLATFSIMSGSKAPGVSDFAGASRFHFCAKADAADRAGSRHPTVKPTSLMRWLVQLVTPPGGTVLDPFAGTGSTGLAADQLGMNAVLIERDPTYAADARRKITGDAPLFTEVA